MSTKVNNFQEEFTIHDIKVARDVKATYNCGMSRIALKAPNQIYRIHKRLMQEPDCASALIEATTLKLEYAIQVWCRAALISAKNPSNLLYYWWLNWTSDGSPFNKLEYNKFYRDITVEQLLQWFWDLLEDIANSGEIKVEERYYLESEGVGYCSPNVKCHLVLDAETGKEVVAKVDNVYTYSYNKEQKTYSWEEIKDFFYEMSLDQLRLIMPDKLHNHTSLDDTLLRACSQWDVEQIKLAMQRGANINCLDKSGESVLQQAVEYYKDHNVLIDNNYSREELAAIADANEQKCKEVVDLLLSYGADINLFGYDGLTPLMCAYYQRSPEMIKFLLERGATPNWNCYLEDDEYWPRLKNIRSTILNNIDDLLYEDYGDNEREIETIIRDAGGRKYVWDFNPWTYENIGKFLIHMVPSEKGENLFFDNARWCVGTVTQLTIEDQDVNKTVVSLASIDGIEQWVTDFQKNREHHDYDWQSWKRRGLELAKKVAAILPDSASLFYLYDNEMVMEKAVWHPSREPKENELQLCREGTPICIK